MGKCCEKTERNDMFRAESLNFLGAIDGKEENLCPVEEAVKSLIACRMIKPD